MSRANGKRKASARQRNEQTRLDRPKMEHIFLSAQPSNVPRAPALPSGAVINRFRIERHLGSGSLADVYLAYDQTRGQEVAIKIVNDGPMGSKAAGELLRSELMAYSQVKDFQHVLRVYDLHPVSWGGTKLLLLSMEYADGGTLRTWLQNHKDCPESRRTQGLEYVWQLCLGVKAMHDVGLPHLDITPGNALFVGGILKVADCGTLASLRPSLDIETTQRQPDQGILRIGTPQYSSPEHYRALCRDDLDARADIYSIGILLFEVIHPKGLTPFVGSSWSPDELDSRAHVPILPGATETQTRVVNRCLQQDASKRYQCITELLDDLQGRDAGPQGLDSEGTEQLWQQACRCLEDGRLAEAQRLCGRILAKTSDHEDAQVLQDQIRERSQQAQQLYSAVAQGLDTLNLEQLIALVAEAERAFPDHPSGRVVHVRLASKASQYRRAMEAGAAGVRRGDWTAALSAFQNARELNPGAPEAEGPVHFMTQVLDQIRRCQESIDSAIEVGDGAHAMALARSLDEYCDQMRRSSPEGADGGHHGAGARDCG